MCNTRLCPKCGKEITYSTKATYRQACSRDSACKSCRTTAANKSPNRRVDKESNPAWKGYNGIPYAWFSGYFEKKSAKKRTGDISIEQVYDLWIKQNMLCALSGVPIGFYDDGNRHTCSIDRIDSSREYLIDNIQLVHKDINLMKNRFDNQYFIDMCKRIAEHN